MVLGSIFAFLPFNIRLATHFALPRNTVKLVSASIVSNSFVLSWQDAYEDIDSSTTCNMQLVPLIYHSLQFEIHCQLATPL